MSIYLAENHVSQWKYEQTPHLLVDKGLRISLIDADLKDLGAVYQEDANKVYQTRNVKYSDEKTKKWRH